MNTLYFVFIGKILLKMSINSLFPSFDLFTCLSLTQIALKLCLWLPVIVQVAG